MRAQLQLWPESAVPTLLMHLDYDRARIVTHAEDLSPAHVMALLGEQALFARVLDRILAGHPEIVRLSFPSAPMPPSRWRVRSRQP